MMFFDLCVFFMCSQTLADHCISYLCELSAEWFNLLVEAHPIVLFASSCTLIPRNSFHRRLKTRQGRKEIQILFAFWSIEHIGLCYDTICQSRWSAGRQSVLRRKTINVGHDTQTFQTSFCHNSQDFLAEQTSAFVMPLLMAVTLAVGHKISGQQTWFVSFSLIHCLMAELNSAFCKSERAWSSFKITETRENGHYCAHHLTTFSINRDEK